MLEASDVLEKLRYQVIAAGADKVRCEGIIAELKCEVLKLEQIGENLKCRNLEAFEEVDGFRGQLLETSSQAAERKCLEAKQTVLNQELRCENQGAHMCKKKSDQIIDSALFGGPNIPDVIRVIKDLSTRNEFDKIQVLLMESENEMKMRMEKDRASFQSGQALAEIEKLKFEDMFEKSLLECNELKEKLSAIEENTDGVIEEMRRQIQEASEVLEKLRHRAMAAGVDKIISEEIITNLKCRESLLDQIVELLNCWNSESSQMVEFFRYQLSGADAKKKKSDQTNNEMRNQNIEAEMFNKGLRRENLEMLGWLLAAHEPGKMLDDTIEKLRHTSWSEVGEALKETMDRASGASKAMIENLWSQKMKADKTIEELRLQNLEALKSLKELRCVILDGHEVFQVNKERWEVSPRTIMIAEGLINVLKFMVQDRANLVSKEAINDVDSPSFKGSIEVMNDEDEANLGKVVCIADVSADMDEEKTVTGLPSSSLSIHPVNFVPGKREALEKTDNDHIRSRKMKKHVKKPTDDRDEYLCRWSLELHKWVTQADIPNNFQEDMELKECCWRTQQVHHRHKTS